MASVTITDAGNVGIGTASPATALHVNRGTSGAEVLRLQGGTGAFNDPYLSFYKSDGSARNGYIQASPTDFGVGLNGSGNITFSSNGAERMRIDASGRLLVGKTTAPDNIIGIAFAPDGGAYFSQNGTINFLTCFNTTANAYRFYVTAAGQINATSTSIVGISDISLKENIRDLETGLSQVLALKPRRFDWKKETQIDQKNAAGFIAQEVEEVLPELVYEYKYNETETKKSLKMGDMLPTLVKAIQEQQAQIEALKAEVAALKAP